jgi:hypothetical protein
MRTLPRFLLYALPGTTIAVGALWLVAWRSPPFYDAPKVDYPAAILTMEQYDSVSQCHPRPYVVRASSATGGTVLFGASHTRNPDDPQLATLRREWAAFRPTVALVEGRLGFLLPSVSDPVEAFGEMGAAASLAKTDGIRLYSWEPRREVEIARMLERFPAEQVALFYVLRPYFSQIRFGRPENPEGFVEEYRKTRTAYPGLEGTLPSVATIDSLWTRDFSGLADWRETSDEYGLPGYLADLSSHSNALRDEHLAGIILDLVRRGERVFAVAGSSHAVKLEPALRAALDPSHLGDPRASCSHSLRPAPDRGTRHQNEGEPTEDAASRRGARAPARG